MTESAGFASWLGHYPELKAFLVIVVGWLCAILLRRAVAIALVRFNRSSLSSGFRNGPVLTPQFTQMLQLLVFWGILLASIILGFSLLGHGKFATWMDGLWVFFSRLLVGFAILAVGHVLGLLVRSLITGLARKTDVTALARFVYALIVGIALIMAIDHLGLDMSFLTQIVLVLITVFFAGLALAFAAGAKEQVANLVAQGDLLRYRQGDRIRVDGVEGTVVEVHRTGLVLSTSEGFAHIPASKFSGNTVIVLGQESEDDG